MPDYIKDAIPILAMLISALALYRNIKGDTRQDGATASEVLVKIELMQDDLKEIKADIKAEIRTIKDDVEDLKERVIVVEQSTKSAHRRIDGLHGEHIAEE